MKPSLEQFVLRVMSGEARGIAPSVLRGVLRCSEPFYTAAVSWRNRKYDRGKGIKRLPRPVISVGNLTAGGTGKTPVVRWLCERLRAAGRHPAVLMRGYGAKPGERGDEQAMLESYLNHDASMPTPGSLPRNDVIVQANPNRFEGGIAVLSNHPGTNIFVLDDGFQHRRLARDFDLVLVDAACPFGYGHVHPRGLLREPVRGLDRADAILITRCDAVNPEEFATIKTLIRRWNKAAPLYRSRHTHTGARVTDAAGATHQLPLSKFDGARVFAFCGIGRPASFLAQVRELSSTFAGSRTFADHYSYSRQEMTSLSAEAAAKNATVLLTTEKDWVKIAPLADALRLPVWRMELAIQFEDDDETKLFQQMDARVAI